MTLQVYYFGIEYHLFLIFLVGIDICPSFSLHKAGQSEDDTGLQTFDMQMLGLCHCGVLTYMASLQG